MLIKNFKKILIALFVFYFLSLFQSSFLVHFSFAGITLNLIFIIVLLLSIFENKKISEQLYKEKFWLKYSTLGAILGGFFLDIFSSQFIGFHILILLGTVAVIKIILKKYVRILI